MRSEEALYRSVITAKKAGATDRQIASWLGISKNVIKKILKQERKDRRDMENSMRQQQQLPSPQEVTEPATKVEAQEHQGVYHATLRMPYSLLVNQFPDETQEALSEHRRMTSKAQNLAPENLEWFLMWVTPAIDQEDILKDLSSFVMSFVKGIQKCVVGCTCRWAGLRFRVSTPVKTIPNYVKIACVKDAEQWWRDPKTAEMLLDKGHRLINPYVTWGPT